MPDLSITQAQCRETAGFLFHAKTSRGNPGFEQGFWQGTDHKKAPTVLGLYPGFAKRKVNIPAPVGMIGGLPGHGGISSGFMNWFLPNFKWTVSSKFGTYRLCEQQRFRRACASAQSRQNLRCLLIQAVSQEEPSDRKPDPWPL